MDVIAASQAGIKNVVAVSGTALTQEQITMIKRYTENIRMFFDMDSAGENATKKSIKLCFGKEMNVRVVELPEGKDAADLAKSSPEKLLEAVEKAPGAMEYFFQKTFSKYDKEKVEDQKKITADLLDMISAMSSEIEKSHWVRKLSQELNLKEAILTDMLKKATFKDIITPSSRGLATAVAKSEPKNKLELLVQSVIGLALVFPEVWEAACVTEMANPVLQANDLMRMMLQKGRAVQFNFDNFVRTLESREAADEVRKIYSEKKYKIGLNNEIEEIILKSPKEEFERHIRDIQREAQRIELEKIEHDQKLAEERGDKEALNFLCQEARRISNSLASLN
jgi:DNA primase